MATKYTKTQITETAPNWSASGAEPPSTMKSQGFLSGYKPPAAYFNWFWTKVSVLFGQILTVVNKIQDYLNNKCFYIRQDIGYISTVGYLVSYMNQGAAMDETVILSFLADVSLFRAFGIVKDDEGELNCKLKVITFPKKGIVLKYNRGGFEKVETAISDRSLSTAKIDATLHTAVYGGTADTLPDLIAMLEDSDDDVVVTYFDIGNGSLRSITHNADFGMYNSYNGMLCCDNGYFFTIDDNGVLIQKTQINASALVDGSITKEKLSAELKAELGLN